MCFSLHAVPSAHSFTWRCSANYLMHAGCPATKACVFTPGSLSACHRIIGRASGRPLFSSPHHSLGKLINSSPRPTIIYSISWPISELVVFICLSQSLLAAVFVPRSDCRPLFLCSVPCKTIRLALALVITLIHRCFNARHG